MNPAEGSFVEGLLGRVAADRPSPECDARILAALIAETARSRTMPSGAASRPRAALGGVIAMAAAAVVLAGLVAWTALAPQDSSAPVESPKPTQERPFIGDREDLEAVKRSWSVNVKLDFADATLDQVVASLAKQSGIRIAVAPGTVPEPRGYGSGIGGLDYDRVGRYLDLPGIAEVQTVTFEFDKGRGKGAARIKAGAPVPLGVALLVAARAFGLEVAHRADGPALGSFEALREELLMTRRIPLRHGGKTIMLRRGGENPVLREVSLEDGAAFRILERTYRAREARELANRPWSGEATDGWPAGAAAELRKLGLGFDARHDEPGKALVIVADAGTQVLLKHQLNDLDQDAPAEAARKAVRFREDRLAQWIRASGTKSAAEDDRLVELLAEGGVAQREDSEEALAKRGLAGAAAILGNRSGSEDAEFRIRSGRVLARIYAEIERREILDRANAYLKAGMAGELDRIRREFWTEGRRRQDEEQRRSFEETRDAAKGTPARWREFLKVYDLPATTKPEEVTHDRELAASMAILEPRIERLRISGPVVEIRYSARVPAGHFAQELTREHGSRLASSFFMEFDGRAWMGGEEGTFSDHECLYWSSKAGWGGRRLETKASRAGGLRGEDSAAGWVSAYAVSFGY